MKTNSLSWSSNIFLVVISTQILVKAQPQGGNGPLTCQFYSKVSGSDTVCDEFPDQVCKSGCTGAVSINDCSKEGDDKKSKQTCTISAKKSGDNIYTCINEESTFSCKGSIEGSLSCSGCVKSAGGVQVTGSFESSMSANKSSSSSSSYSWSVSGGNPPPGHKGDVKETYPTDQKPPNNGTNNFKKDDPKDSYPSPDGKNSTPGGPPPDYPTDTDKQDDQYPSSAEKVESSAQKVLFLSALAVMLGTLCLA